ncbi:copper chaperone PCu(A)C [Sulfitobacter sp. F26204]|uniref:copper chaperone PCu(A)C n=1 Tax=Sulfitobacter sp. F26204 TaxID=2996014 RepID=UPI00225E49D7|nr:copper chaperone PCu(A)C [Sulfitobacter sp. F26204]MCX7559006.1 copper chaperone PCu(A)C [Sulfitobacter sp. F26204]
MKVSQIVAAGIAVLALGTSVALADGIEIKDAYVRSSTPTSKTGAAFMTLMNNGDTDDRLVAVSSAVANRVELHTHRQSADGVMQMMEIEGGIVVPAGGMHLLKRGGDHVMFMGLTAPLVQGEDVEVIMTFEQAGDVEVTIPVDHDRKPEHRALDHSKQD